MSQRGFSLRRVSCVAHTLFQACAFASCLDDMVMKRGI